MKKLIWLMVLGVIFFIGGQWIGLSFSEANRSNLAENAQNGSASPVPQTNDRLELVPNPEGAKHDEFQPVQSEKNPKAPAPPEKNSKLPAQPETVKLPKPQIKAGPVLPKPTLKPRKKETVTQEEPTDLKLTNPGDPEPMIEPDKATPVPQVLPEKTELEPSKDEP